MDNKVYGYVRVSTKGQNEDRQIVAMREANVPEENIYVDKISGKDFVRPEYLKLCRKLKESDLLYIKSIDRLGRNYEEILEQWRQLVKIKKVDVAVIDMPLLDTRQGKNVLGNFVADLILQILSFVAENERENIRMRQAEGIAAAKARGVRFGRPKSEITDLVQTVYWELQKGHLSKSDAARSCNISPQLFNYYVKKMEKK